MRVRNFVSVDGSHSPRRSQAKSAKIKLLVIDAMIPGNKRRSFSVKMIERQLIGASSRTYRVRYAGRMFALHPREQLERELKHFNGMKFKPDASSKAMMEALDRPLPFILPHQGK